eukprot:TRINITY_DN2229_c0_g2_i3.p1 TRINITY_DN2229_c0_g2~~TRINITY_DN2229_c0_g2_i3.p1  ORF type:complete len:260 (-),score=57.14 TRINITY_DN2229_c0_g2_i3:221-1000(-)
MATLSQSAILPGSILSIWHSRSDLKRSKDVPKVMAFLHHSNVSMQSQSGLCVPTSVDMLRKSTTSFFPSVRGPIKQSRGRGSRFVPVMMFQRCTKKAIKVIVLSNEEARRLEHNFLGTEQLILGLIGEGTGIAAKVLESMGINLKDARVEVEKISGKGEGLVGIEIPFSPRAKRVLQYSLNEAKQLGHSSVGPEHLLLGLLRVRDCVALRVLENLGATPSNIRREVIQVIGESTETVGAGGGGGTGTAKLPTPEEAEET